MDLVFVILRCVRNPSQNHLWRRAVASVQEFHPDAPIVIIDDNSTAATRLDVSGNISIVQSEFPGAGESLPYYYFLKYRWADRMIFIHDSMFLRRAFQPDELSGEGTFLWYFDDHRYDDDKRIEQILGNKHELIAFNQHKQAWHGCFGGAMYCTYSMIRRIEDQYGIFAHCVQRLKTRPDRMGFERILAIVMFHAGVVSLEKCSIQGSIFGHPFRFRNNISRQAIEIVKRTYPFACDKEWVGR
jgi:hypothetical protein